MKRRSFKCWSIKWRSQNRLDGKVEYLLGTTVHPSRTVLFETRRQAIEYREREFGYLRKRPDLRREPHGWKMPLVMRVEVMIREVGQR
jgi:hypothetical protein